ncbi:hypothetical protein M404DRAFT_995380 [Pisolithus tinctorius Marx 270]|uniref:Uncharacterized protein n=1 Tax=Pisolithus tinctorius Marx 270 TaxID=870435 RepID=A0A0C3PQX4_PISTI|nr:hypothetical protein M404DRAFT_995380 [Pisolithus tinctorius Marx 270]
MGMPGFVSVSRNSIVVEVTLADVAGVAMPHNLASTTLPSTVQFDLAPQVSYIVCISV